VETLRLMIFIDTDVLVECLRGSTVAKTWLGTLQKDAFGIPGVVAMELLMGCRNHADLQHVQRFLNSFKVTWPEAFEFAQAYNLLASLCLSSGLGIPDCLIAAMSLARGARLYTFNLKHFNVVPGLDVQQPYARP
jgi:tRNA(fMet)-specific endonuclease VapC